eukprot:664077-Karenia_brevis.AAC.1
MVVDGGSGSAAGSSGGVGTLRTTTGSATSFVRTKDDGIGHGTESQPPTRRPRLQQTDAPEPVVTSPKAKRRVEPT